MGTKWPRVTCNELVGDISSLENSRLGSGIRVDGNNSFILGCNTTEKFRWGINISGECTGDNFIQGNTLSDHWTGLNYGYSAITGHQEHYGNIWKGDFYFYGAVHMGEFQTVLRSKFYYDSGDNSLFEPPTISSSTSWFFDRVGESFHCQYESFEYCPEGIGTGLWSPSWDSLDLKLSTQNIGLSKFDNSMTWKSRFWIYRRFREETSLPTSLSTFVSNNTTSKIGLFSNAHDSLTQALIYAGPLAPVLEEFPDKLEGLYLDILYFDSLIVEGLNFDSLNSLRQTKYDTIFLLECNYRLKDSVITSKLNVKLENAINYVGSISTDSIWEEALKYTLLEFLSAARGDTLINSTDIYNLAISCPDKYGDAVYYARSLIRMDSLINYYDDDSECSFLAPRSSQESLPSGKIYPNPGKDLVEIHSESEISYLDVFNLSGIRLAIPYNVNTAPAYLNTETLPEGIYFIRIVNKMNEIRVFKLIITR